MMKLFHFAWTTCLILILSSGGIAADIRAVRLAGSVQIDGRLEEKAWQSAPANADFRVAAGKPAPSAGTSVRILYDSRAIYFGIRCEEPEPGAMLQADRGRDGSTYAYDSIEIMLDPAATQERYYHFMVSTTGDMLDEFFEQGGGVCTRAWNGIWKAATVVGKDFWSCEVKIPFYNFAESGKLGGPWLVNVCRNKRSKPGSDTSLANGAYHSLAEFPKLIGLDVDFSPYRLDAMLLQPEIKVIGAGRLAMVNTAKIANCSSSSKKYTAESWLQDPRTGRVTVAPEVAFSLSSGERRNIELPHIPVARQGTFRNMFRLADASGRTVAYKEQNSEVRFSPVTIRLDTPWYRNTIFASQKIENVIFDVKVAMPSEELAEKQMKIVVEDGSRSVYSMLVKNVKQLQRLTIPAAELPFGRFVLKSILLNQAGNQVNFGSAETPLWKLPFKAGEVWLDRDCSIMREGRPFFFMTAYSAAQFTYPEFTLHYRLSPDGIGENQLWLSSNLAFRPDAESPAVLKPLQSGFMTREDLKLYVDQIKKDRNHPKIFGYYIYDEPSARSVSVNSLKQVYEAIREADPYHPVVISDSPLNAYIEACDIQIHHPYPNVVASLDNNDCRAIYDSMRSGQRRMEESGHKVAFVFMDMGFNKYDYGLGPRNGRMTTFEEYRDHMIMAFAVGMKGTMPFYVSCEIYPEATIGFPAIAKLTAWLGPYMNNRSAGRSFSPDNADLHTRWRTDGRDCVLAASNVSMKPGRYTIRLENLPPEVKVLQVVGEERTVPVVDGTIRDDFDPCGGHIYTTGAMPALPSKSSVEEAIEAAWQKRAKPGNLVFRRYLCQNNTRVTASISQSTRHAMSTQDSMLWHLTDGYFPVKPGGYGFWYWRAKAEKLPAWVMLELEERHEVERVVVYPMLNSVKKMTCEVEVNGKWWKEVGRVENCYDKSIEFRFPPEKTSKIRLNLLESNGPSGYIGEVEVYRK